MNENNFLNNENLENCLLEDEDLKMVSGGFNIQEGIEWVKSKLAGNDQKNNQSSVNLNPDKKSESGKPLKSFQKC